MATYKITNNKTGETIRVSGNKPPTQAEVAEIFASRQSTQPSKPEDSRTGFQKVADFLGLTTATGNVGVLNLFGQEGRTEQAGKTSSEAYKRSQSLIEQAKQETDPAKKKQLVDQARSIMQGSEAKMDTFQKDLAKKQDQARITEKDLTRSDLDFKLRRTLGQSAELAALLMPFTEPFRAAQVAAKLGTAGQRISQAGIAGATSGSLQGLANATRESDTIGEALTSVGAGGVIGGVAGAGLQTGVEGVKYATKKAAQLANQLAPKRVLAFIKGTGKGLKESAEGIGSPKNATAELTGLDSNKNLIKNWKLTHDVTDPLERGSELAKNITGETYDEIYKSTLTNKNQTGQVLGEFLQNENAPLDVKRLANKVLTEANKTAKVDSKKSQQMIQVLEEILNNNPDLDKVTGNSLKSTLNQILYTATGKAKNVTPLSSAKQQVYEILSKELSNQVKDGLSDTAQQAFEDYAIWNLFESSLEKKLGIIPGMVEMGALDSIPKAITNKITSGFRSPEYLMEIIKNEPGLLRQILNAGGNITGQAVNQTQQGINRVSPLVAPTQQSAVSNISAANLTPELLKLLGIQ